MSYFSSFLIFLNILETSFSLFSHSVLLFLVFSLAPTLFILLFIFCLFHDIFSHAITMLFFDLFISQLKQNQEKRSECKQIHFNTFYSDQGEDFKQVRCVLMFPQNNFHCCSDVFFLFQSAVGLFQSKVKVHLLLFANRGSDDYIQLKERLEALAPQYAGKVILLLLSMLA